MGDQDKYELFKSEDGKLRALSPDGKEYVPVNDVREETKESSDRYPPSDDAKKHFYQQRIKQVQSSRLRSGHKEYLLKELEQSVKKLESKADGNSTEPPIPGGVGFGVYYKEDALKFDNSSALVYRIVTIPGIGSNLNDWLYLTSTNHSPRGTEAFVSYHQQEAPTFIVFDWSREGDAQWALSKPYEELGMYLTSHSVDNHHYPTILVVNSTRRVLATKWINEVMLFNRVANAYDLVYSHEYELPEDEEENRLDWGPIVETFPPFPNETNRIGFFEAKLRQDGKEHSLTQSLTELRIDDEGFEIVYFRPNSSFIVH